MKYIFLGIFTITACVVMFRIGQLFYEIFFIK